MQARFSNGHPGPVRSCGDLSGRQHAHRRHGRRRARRHERESREVLHAGQGTLQHPAEHGAVDDEADGEGHAQAPQAGVAAPLALGAARTARRSDPQAGAQRKEQHGRRQKRHGGREPPRRKTVAPP